MQGRLKLHVCQEPFLAPMYNFIVADVPCFTVHGWSHTHSGIGIDALDFLVSGLCMWVL